MEVVVVVLETRDGVVVVVGTVGDGVDVVVVTVVAGDGVVVVVVIAGEGVVIVVVVSPSFSPVSRLLPPPSCLPSSRSILSNGAAAGSWCPRHFCKSK